MSLICGKWQLTKKRQSGNISLYRDGEREYLKWKLFRRNLRSPGNCHLARRGRLVHHSRTLSKWIPCSKRRQNCFPSPLCLPEIRFCICQILKGVSFAFSSQKKVPFIACKDFGQDAQNARVANWWRQCIESAIGKNAGKGGNTITFTFASQYQFWSFYQLPFNLAYQNIKDWRFNWKSNGKWSWKIFAGCN